MVSSFRAWALETSGAGSRRYGERQLEPQSRSKGPLWGIVGQASAFRPACHISQEVPAMLCRTGIGLDVHARSIAAAAFIPETGEIVQKAFPYDAGKVAEWAKGMPQPIMDCSGGMPLSWPVSTPPDAGMAIPGSARTAAAIAAGRDGQGYSTRMAWPGRCRGRDAASAARGAGASSGGWRQSSSTAAAGPGLRSRSSWTCSTPASDGTGCQDEGRPGLQEPHAASQGLGSAGSVGWIRSKIPTAVPTGSF